MSDKPVSEAPEYFTFAPCYHSMIKPDCPSCCRGHAARLEKQLRKLEASIALPIKARVEAIILENVTNWFQVWKGVPRDTEGWIKNAAHYLSWGINKDLPMVADIAASQLAEKDSSRVERLEVQIEGLMNCLATSQKEIEEPRANLPQIAAKLEEIRACEGGMCGHCIEILCEELIPMASRADSSDSRLEQQLKDAHILLDLVFTQFTMPSELFNALRSVERTLIPVTAPPAEPERIQWCGSCRSLFITTGSIEDYKLVHDHTFKKWTGTSHLLCWCGAARHWRWKPPSFTPDHY